MSKLWRNWFFHNAVGHPAMALLQAVGLERAAVWAHEVTLPEEGPE